MAKRYKIYERLGEGGSATVYRAYDTQMKRWLAIKRLLPAGADLHEAAELRQEAGVLASLNHPHIVTVFDVADDDEGLFMVMELLQGDDLADVLEQGPLSLEDFRELAMQCLAAIHTCHEHRILHRDLKPANIKIDREASGRLQAKIIDFGISRSGMVARKQTERQDGMILGSVHYMAPEQVGRTECDHRADLYSLGCIFYECLSGRRPVDSKSIYELIDKHLTHDITSLQVICPHLPLELVGWVETGLMALRPVDRYSTALEALEAFRSIDIFSTSATTGANVKRRSGSGPSPSQNASSPVPLEQVASSGSKSKLPILLAGAAAILAAGYFILSSGSSDNDSTQSQNIATAPVSSTPPPETQPSKAKTLDTPPPPAPVTSELPPPSTKAESPDLPLDPEYLPLVARTELPATESQIVRFSADVGVSSFDTIGKTRSLRLAELGEPVRIWRDLAAKAKDTPMKAYNNSSDAAPILSAWSAPGIQPERRALHFGEPTAGSTSMTVTRQYSLADDFAFGANAKQGLTWATVLQVNEAYLPTRPGRLVSDNSGILSLRVDEEKRILLESRSRIKQSTTTIVSQGIDATQPLICIAHWDAEKKALSFRVRTADGSSYRSPEITCEPYLRPLRNVEYGRVTEYTTKKPALPLDQYHGHIAEIIYYTTPLSTMELDTLEKVLVQHYFTK